MKKRILWLAVAVALVMSLCIFASAAPTANEAASDLHDLGLLAGKGTNADGSVNFDIGGSLTRAESITQVVRFLGKEKVATSKTNEHPFTDLPTWAVPYVGYAYSGGITQGVSATKFDANGKMTDAAFLTAILRVLGYVDKADGSGDFMWNAPYALAKDVGLIDNTNKNASFTRGDAFVICFNALTATTKNGGETIKDQLIKEGLFTLDEYNKVVSEEAAPAKTGLFSISELNQTSVDGDHANDDYRTASLEMNFRESVVLTSAKTGYSRYDKAYYPRVKKLRDDFYVLLYHYNETGPHIYYATSKDGISWNAPQVFFNQGLAENKFTYTYGPLEGQSDSYWGVNIDGCVLDDGTLFCVYAKRPCNGYRYYPELQGLYSVTATPGENGELVWGEQKRIYTGQVWEPSVLQLENGEIHVYYTQVAPDITEFGYHEIHRSTETGLIISKDGGKTFTPDIQPGNENYYRALTVYREYVGELDGRAHYNGQMPVATELSNGKLLLTVETKQTDGRFRVSYAVSEKEGEWKNLATNEEGVYTKLTEPPNSSPYVDRFPSGEVYMTHNAGGKLVGRLGAADGSEFSATFENAPGSAGMWGSCTVIDSHRVVTAMQSKTDGISGVKLYYSYLNHRINAHTAAIAVDGDTSDWANNTDALFVGSASQAQVTLRAAHDTDNVYFLLSRLDYYLTSGDTATVCISAGASADYRVTVDLSGNVTVDYYQSGSKVSTTVLDKAAVVLYGTLGDNSDKDEGAIIELKVPKASVGLSGKTEFSIRLALSNQDGEGSVSDTFTGVSSYSTKLWPKVVLD